nr:hypothetical protein [Tanacetum cinerariifolium]
NASDLHELMELVRDLVRLIDLVAPPVNATTKREYESYAQLDLAIEVDPAIEVPPSAQREQQSSHASMDQMSSALVVHSSNVEPPAKKLRVILDYPIPALILLNIVTPSTFDII